MNSNPSESRYTLHPLFWTAAAFASGIAMASFELVGVVVAAFLFAALTLFFSTSRHAALLLIVSATAAGAFVFHAERMSIADDRIRQIYDSGRLTEANTITVIATVTSGPEPAFQGAVIEAEVNRLIDRDVETEASGRVRFFISADTDEAQHDLQALGIRSGSVIKTFTTLDRDERFRDPGVRSRREMLDVQEIDATATIKSPLLIEKIADGGRSPLNAIHDLRRSVIADIRGRFNTSTAGILIASTLGDKYFLDRRDSDVFRRGGTFHILVISGLHIAIIGVIVLFFVSRLTRNRYARFIAATAILWTYALAVGLEPPVVRAAIMFTILLFSQVIYRDASMLNSLGLCTLILLTVRPADLFNPSFQLTFLSVMAIVAFAVPIISQMREIGAWMPTGDQPFPPRVSSLTKRVCETLYWNEAAWRIDQGRQVWSANLFKSPLFGWFGSDAFRRTTALIVEGMIVSASVQLFLLPLMAVYFHRIPVLGVLLNIWAGAMLAAESVFALIAIVIGQVSDVLAVPFVRVAELSNWLLVASQQFLLSGSVPDVRVPVYSGRAWAIYVVYFIPLAVIAFAVSRWRPFSRLPSNANGYKLGMASASLALAAAVIVFHPFSEAAPNGRLNVEFLDVGQGDSALITFPNGEKMLIDGGGRPNMGSDDETEDFQPDIPRIGEMVVSEFLWEKGISRIEHVVATHADADHVQGLEDVVSNFSVGRIYVSGAVTDPDEMNTMLRIAEEKEVPVQALVETDAMQIGDVLVEIFWPSSRNSAALSDNNASIVLKITYGDRSFLFTGDIEKNAEEQILQNRGSLTADVLKVPHHGSRTSSTPEFIKASRPSIAVIPVGRRSIFGHPHAEVVERWRSSGATIMTTGQYGTISISTDGQDLNVSTFVSYDPDWF